MKNTAPLSRSDEATPMFWRDEALPFIEAREVLDGRRVCYARHAHDAFSIGAITAGCNVYVNGKVSHHVGAGTVVLMNPHDVHACNPIDDQPWSYRMLYVDTHWLARLQHELGFGDSGGFRPFMDAYTTDPALYAGLNRLHATLTDERAAILQKYCAAVAYLSDVQRTLNPAPAATEHANGKLARAAEYIREHCTQALRLHDICAAADLSASYLIRSFRERYGMTPHEYQLNCRVEYSRTQLKRGRPIVDVAIDAGFADQAHLQRVFKRFTAATPGQYRGRLSDASYA